MDDKLNQIEEDAPLIKVIGVGCGGCNAAAYMYNSGMQDVDFVLCSSNKRSFNNSIPRKILFGPRGRGTGGKPELGLQYAEEKKEVIEDILKSTPTEMVFVTTCFGKGTGTGASPYIAKIAKNLGILTIGFVTIPLSIEGPQKKQIAQTAIDNMRQSVDSLIVISNDRIQEHGRDITLREALHNSDNILATAVRCIVDIINKTGRVNVDMNDVKTVMTDSGDAIMGYGEAEGEDRAARAVFEAVNSPLLINNDIGGATQILLNMCEGKKRFTMREITVITDYLRERIPDECGIIWGITEDESLEEKVSVTVIVTGQKLSNEVLFKTEEEKIEETESVSMEQPSEETVTVSAANDSVSANASASSTIETSTSIFNDKPQVFTSTLEMETAGSGGFDGGSVMVGTRKKIMPMSLDDLNNEDAVQKPNVETKSTLKSTSMTSPEYSNFSISLDGVVSQNLYLNDRPD